MRAPMTTREKSDRPVVPSAEPESHGCPPERGGTSPLSARETEILRLLAEGYSTLNIAMRLNLSHATTRNHVANLNRKLGVHSQAQAITVCFRKGWLS